MDGDRRRAFAHEDRQANGPSSDRNCRDKEHAVGATGSLIERECELELLGKAWREARGGRGSAWLVCAEAGGGKTRLLREAVCATGASARWGTAEPVIPPEPYLAVMQALRGFRPAPQRGESVDRAVETLERLAGDGPITLVLDDLHFADEGTIAVFTRLATSCAERPWLILGALRPGEGSPALRQAVTELMAKGHTRRLDLPPLSRAGVAALAAQVRGRAAGADEVDALVAGGGGNPWFTETLARGDGVPAATRDRLHLGLARIEHTLPGSRDLLAALAPAGEPLPHAAVAAVGGGDGPRLRRILRGLRDAAVLSETESGDWQFRHELMRRSVWEDLLVAERREAHRRLAEALELCGTGNGTWDGGDSRNLPAGVRAPAANLAMHYAAAGDQRAARWGLQAAAEASAVDAHAEALAQAERALSFDADPVIRRAALMRAADEAATLGRFEDSGRYTEAALALPGAEPEERARLHQMAARVLPDAAADTHLRAAEAVLACQPPGPALVRVLITRASRAIDALEPERAATLAERALALVNTCTGHDAIEAEFLARRFLARANGLRADPAGAAATEALVAFAVRHRLPEGFRVAALAEGYPGMVLSLRLREADRLYQRIVPELGRVGLGWGVYLEPFRAIERALRGEYAESRAAVAGCPPADAWPGLVAARRYAELLCEARAGTLDRARTLLAGWPVSGAPQAAMLRDLGTLELAMADGTGDAGNLAQTLYDNMNRRQLACPAGTAAVALARFGLGAPPTPGWLAAGSPARVLWDHATAIEHGDTASLREIAGRLAEMSLWYEAALALADGGDLQTGHRALRALGATTAREHIARRLRVEGRAIPRGPRAGADRVSLTDMERAVCRLVCAGATNPAVADDLGIGVRTVATYLTRIYEKTGRRGRAALAVWWATQESPTSPADTT
jgi:DNA-binding CsgD family transcriptional regulator